MPTEFQRSSEAAALLLKDYEGIASASPAKILEMETTMNALLATAGKFDKKVANGIFGPAMAEKTKAFRGQLDEISASISGSAGEAKQQVQQESEKQAEEEAKELDRQQQENKKKKAKLEEEQEQAKEEEKAKAATVGAALVQKKELTDSEIISDSLIRPTYSEESMGSFGSLAFVRRESETKDAAVEFMKMTFKGLAMATDAKLSEKEVQNVLHSIMQPLEMQTGAIDPNTVGWKKWSAVESSSAFKLMDKEGSGFITFEQFCDFVAIHPLMCGPLVHMERLFCAYDTNNDGKLDESEIFNLLVEVEIEVSNDEPDVDDIQFKAGQLYSNAAKSPRGDDDVRGLTFPEFVQMIFKHPELACTACSMRSYFTTYDADKNGMLDKQELSNMMYHFIDDSGHPLAREEKKFNKLVNEMFKAADKDGNGYVDFPELCNYIFREKESISIFSFVLGMFQIEGGFISASFSKELAVKSSKQAKKDAKATAEGDKKEGTALAVDSFGKEKVKAVKEAFTVFAKGETSPCDTCQAPLLPTDGIARFGCVFCDARCMENHDDDSDDRLAYLRRYSHHGFGRALNYSDYGFDKDTRRWNAQNAKGRFQNNL